MEQKHVKNALSKQPNRKNQKQEKLLLIRIGSMTILTQNQKEEKVYQKMEEFSVGNVIALNPIINFFLKKKYHEASKDII
jgi:hypothetical protein